MSNCLHVYQHCKEGSTLHSGWLQSKLDPSSAPFPVHKFPNENGTRWIHGWPWTVFSTIQSQKAKEPVVHSLWTKRTQVQNRSLSSQEEVQILSPKCSRHLMQPIRCGVSGSLTSPGTWRSGCSISQLRVSSYMVVRHGAWLCGWKRG